MSLLNFLVAFLPVIAGSTAVRYLSLFRSTVSFVSSSICFSGYDQMGTEEIDSQEENKFEGWKSTFDWVMKQHIEVETLSAFPLPARR